jgi:hypothetical protein
MYVNLIMEPAIGVLIKTEDDNFLNQLFFLFKKKNIERLKMTTRIHNAREENELESAITDLVMPGRFPLNRLNTSSNIGTI